ncbi:MAG: hypothetical protein K2X01_00205 [Cyanobacteria bacterium]|nr:hypothetical protein [Cyanobacteriota bacterium]
MQVSNGAGGPKPKPNLKKPPVKPQPPPKPANNDSWDPYNALPPAYWHGPRQ